ncbi:hypothetical protein [Devosia sp.]|uniref:hypothetical protein n=1 Tax=Devosia sp. TaxID=1871048 RepID=UPI0025FE9F50|nr:hypothetical protein [Devosia sp.]MCR6634231.1 hypothetical protein [Devosia sp.]
MTLPQFFDDAPTLKMRDPLAAFLGAAEDGVIEYRYADAVRLAGHSCPAVAGAYLMVLNGLSALYDDEIPERGGIEVFMRNERDHATTGVLASVATLLTGAAPESGFQGIGPAKRFARKDLLSFETDIDGTLALRRSDTGKGVVVDINTDHVPHELIMSQLMPKAVSGKANAEELAEFARLWQDRVRRMLVEHADDPKLVHIYDWDGA